MLIEYNLGMAPSVKEKIVGLQKMVLEHKYLIYNSSENIVSHMIV